MKWFKHQSSARNDERLSRLEDKAGLEGYGFYFKMLEIVAEVIDETDRHEVTYSLSRWGRQANITSKKFIFLAQCCADVGLLIVQRCDNDYIIRIPNLLKYRDNHTKNLQATSKQEVEVEVDKEVDKEQIKKQSKPKSKELSEIPVQFVLPDWINQESWNGFVAMRKAIKKPLTLHAMGLLILSLQKMASDGEDVNAVLNQSVMNSWQGIFPLKTNQRMSFADRKAQERKDNAAALDAWARGEQRGPNSTFIEGEFGRA